MPTIIARGKATIDGVVGTFDVIAAVGQTAKLSVAGDEQTEKDNLGFDTAWRIRNLHYTVDATFLLAGATYTAAKATGAIIAPYTTVTLSAFDIAGFNGAYHLMLGQELDLGNTKAGTMNVKLRRYADATQNTSAVSTPS